MNMKAKLIVIVFILIAASVACQGLVQEFGDWQVWESKKSLLDVPQTVVARFGDPGLMLITDNGTEADPWAVSIIIDGAYLGSKMDRVDTVFMTDAMKEPKICESTLTDNDSFILDYEQALEILEELTNDSATQFIFRVTAYDGETFDYAEVLTPIDLALALNYIWPDAWEVKDES